MQGTGTASSTIDIIGFVRPTTLLSLISLSLLFFAEAIVSTPRMVIFLRDLFTGSHPQPENTDSNTGKNANICLLLAARLVRILCQAGKAPASILLSEGVVIAMMNQVIIANVSAQKCSYCFESDNLCFSFSTLRVSRLSLSLPLYTLLPLSNSSQTVAFAKFFRFCFCRSLVCRLSNTCCRANNTYFYHDDMC